MKDKIFLNNYLYDYSNLVKPNAKIIDQLISIKKLLIKTKKNNSKTLIFGNGGSAAIASHFSVDLTKNAGIRSINFNEPDLITCFSNDFGFENWVSEAIKFYSDEGDLLIVISSSGSSKNMINAVKKSKKYKISKVITLTGFNSNNSLKKLGDINLWVDSKAYNFIENTHQLWLLSIVDLIIGKREYSA